MRTFSRSEFEASLAAWDAGEFSDEWKPFRHQAALGGMIYPPEGTRWDSWEDDSPSQRAMLIRAIREQPTLLRQCTAGARSWSQVIERLLRQRDDWREEAAEREAEAARFKREEREVSRSAMSHVADVLATIANSGRPLR